LTYNDPILQGNIGGEQHISMGSAMSPSLEGGAPASPDYLGSYLRPNCLT